MKHLSILFITLFVLVVAGITTTSAQTTPTTPNFSVGSFLDTSATPQSRQGWLGIGAIADINTPRACPSGVTNCFLRNQTTKEIEGPNGTLDVRGVSVMDSLKVLGNAVVNNKMVIGGAGLPTTNGLKVMGGNIRVSALGGSNKKTICIQPNGVLGICNTAETIHTDKCSNISGIQTKLPYTYYEQGTGRAVTVNDPDSDGICTRTTNPKCSDGVDSSTAVEPADTDTAADAADGNCYVPVIPGQPTVTTRPSNALTASKFLATIGRPVLKIGNNWYVYDPLKDSETDTQNQVCLNGVVESPEQCDDGNTSNTDACINNCTNAFCGDYYVRAGVEQCDNGAANANTGSAACSTSCTWRSWCGDGVVQTPNSNGQSEQCDLGSGNSATSACSTSCTVNKIYVRITPQDITLNGSNSFPSGPNYQSNQTISFRGPHGSTGAGNCNGVNSIYTLQKLSFFSNSAGTVPINISSIPGGLTIHYRSMCTNYFGPYGGCPGGLYYTWMDDTQYINSGTFARIEEGNYYVDVYPDPNVTGYSFCIQDGYDFTTEIKNGTSLSTLKYEIIP